MDNYINTINTFNMNIELRQWCVSRSRTFQHQFIFYHSALHFDIQESINRAMTETDDILVELQNRILDILERNSLSDSEKLVYITDAIS